MKIKSDFKISIFLYLIIFFCFTSVSLFAQSSNEIPELDKIFDLSNKTAYLPETRQTFRGSSSLDQNVLELSFKKTLEDNGFTFRRDKAFFLDKLRRLRFDRDDLVMDISLYDRESRGTDIVVREYLASESTGDQKDLIFFADKLPVTRPASINELVSIINEADVSKIPKYKFPKYGPAPEIKTPMNFLGPIDIPPPPEARLLSNEIPTSLADSNASGATYHSKSNVKQVETFYQGFFKDNGFEQRKGLSFNVAAVKRIRYEKSDMAVEIYLTPRQDDTCEVTVIKYANRNGMTKAEVDPFATVVLPKEDNAESSDLEDIPRPDNSVRYSGSADNKGANVSYLLPLTVDEAYNFYVKEMATMGWKLKSQMNTAKICDNYSESHNGLSLVPSLFVGSKLDIGSIIKNSYMLEFESDTALAKVMIYANFMHPQSGSIAYIMYTQKMGKQ
ncbi:MAG: hypothetical protein NTZ63_06960 [Candidatus Omnitrophica bacterium]|nr:hypothetical protein [Candidatus Omnitrophota bacterium]